MEDHRIRMLRAEEIECRAAVVKETGLSILLYKDARVDQRILDEKFGMFGWKRSHLSIDGNLYCTVEIFDRKSGVWVSKQDVGTTGYTEKEKSQASDSFKRACFNWGIGRELYTAPFIWIVSGNAGIQKKDGRFYCSDHFSVREIAYNGDREITYLAVINDTNKGRLVYEFRKEKDMSGPQTDSARKAGKPKPGLANSGKPASDLKNTGRITDMQMHSLEAEMQRTGVGADAVKGRYQIDELRNMSAELYGKVMQALAKTKSAGNVA